MGAYYGKFCKVQDSGRTEGKGLPFFLIVLSFFYIELFSFFFLSLTEEFVPDQLWP